MVCNDEALLKTMLELCCDDLLSWRICLTLYPSDASAYPFTGLAHGSPHEISARPNLRRFRSLAVAVLDPNYGDDDVVLRSLNLSSLSELVDLRPLQRLQRLRCRQGSAIIVL